MINYRYVLDLVVILALLAGFGYGVHRYNEYQQGIGAARVQADWDKATIAAQQAQRARELQNQKDKDDAIKQAAAQLQVATAAASAAAQSNRVLDGTVKALLARSGTDSVDANRRYVEALAAVFSECSERYRALGQEADKLYIDKWQLINAWPK